MKIVCKNIPTRGKKSKIEAKQLKDQLTSFYNDHYKDLMDINDLDDLNYKHINIVLEYLANELMVAYEANIYLHFVEYVQRFINCVFRKSEYLESIKKMRSYTTLKSMFCSDLSKVKYDILLGNVTKETDNIKKSSKEFLHN